jgi:hypothetical protein
MSNDNNNNAVVHTTQCNKLNDKIEAIGLVMQENIYLTQKRNEPIQDLRVKSETVKQQSDQLFRSAKKTRHCWLRRQLRKLRHVIFKR